MSRSQPIRLAIALAALFLGGTVSADAIVRTQAMSASTIVEYFVGSGEVRIELEIGLADLQAFANLLPDEIYERLGNPPRAWSERLVELFEQDFVVAFDDGAPAPGRIVEFVARERVRRDEITGEPLPAGADEEETVIFVRLEFPMPQRPETITIGGSLTSRASVGFVLYHDTIAVNDFRYLTVSQTVDLDWSDPWYSSFRTRSLRRAYFAPMSGFLYVEPYEVRKEVIVRPKDLQAFVDLGLEGRDSIPAEMQDQLKRTIGEFLRQRQRVTIDGEEPTPDLARIHFLERTLRTSRVIDSPRELDLDAAILGAIFVYPTAGLPQRVTMEWDLFNDRITVVPAASVDQAGPLPSYLDPQDRVLEWRNFLTNPELPTMTAIVSPPGPLARGAAVLRWPLAALGLLASVWCVRGATSRARGLGRRLVAMVLIWIATAGCVWAGREARLGGEAAREVVGGLLHNVYRAFDYRDEEQIYDVLDRSVAGELLTDLYLETRRGLELANQGGARAKVKEIELTELEAAPADDGFSARATWVVAGAVGHWGHVHQRRNRYRAELDIRPVDGAWKVTGIEILEEERL